MKRAIIVLVIVAAIGAGGWTYYVRHSSVELTVNTSPVTRGEIIDAVASTGTLQAVVSVTVGSQVSGNISWLGADFNSIVKKGQVIARLDPTLFQAQVSQSAANLANAKAQILKDQASLAYSKVTLQRNTDLQKRGIVTQDALDASKAAADQMAAQVEVDQAQIKQAQAQLSSSQTNLDHTIITSPIDGIVTQRSVDVGQTVAASMTAPVIFIIAADLTKMQVSANIDESDVGRVRPNQPVTFRVDAYPGVDFDGTVSQIRLNPIVVNNVTTYATMINVPNNDLRLKPGMTANLKVQVNRRTDALRVPNTALRFRPTADMFAALNQPVPPEAIGGGRGRGGQGGGRANAGNATSSNAGGGNAGTSTPPPSEQPPAAAPGAAGSGGGGRGGNQGGDAAERAQRQLARFKAMSPDDQKQFIARLKERGQDTSAFEAAAPAPSAPPAKPGAAAAKPSTGKSALADAFVPKYGSAQSSQSIDALFAPLPPVESRGRVWVYVDKQLKPVNLRLGITDGTNTELLSGEVQQGTEVVTTIAGMTATRTNGAPGNSGNPLLPQRGGPGRGR
jgi:HlyD family secretion protein